MSDEYQAYFEAKVNEQLMRALIQRKQGCKKLYRKSEWEQFRLPQGVPPMKEKGSFLQLRKYFYGKPVPCLEDFEGNKEKKLEEMKERYKALDPILERYKGKLILAGGCFTEQWTCRDLDFYFINCSEEERIAIIEDCRILIDHCHAEREEQPTLMVEQQEGVVNIVLIETTTLARNKFQQLMRIVYQFIDKSYSSMGEVLLDFDMYGAMIAYDGQEVWATDLGAWAYVNSCNVIDISWISPYFFLRFEKYTQHKNFRMIIPGVKSIPKLQPYYLEKTNYRQPIGLVAGVCKNLFLAHDPTMKNGAVRFCFALVSPQSEGILEKRAQFSLVNDKREYPKSNSSLSPKEFYSNPDPHFTYFSSPEVDKLLFLAKRFDRNSLISLLPREVLLLIMLWIPFV